MVDVGDALDIGVALDGHRIEAKVFALHLEGGLERSQALHGGLRPRVLVAIEQGNPILVRDRHH